jgi:hypothetical protein
MRTPIQLAATATPGEPDCIFVLCNDGSIWEYYNRAIGTPEQNWRRLPDVPQDAQPPGAGKAVELSPSAFTTYPACPKKF